MKNQSILFHENINGKLCPETVTFSMIFKFVPSRKIQVNQHFDFWYSPKHRDANGIESLKQKEFAFQALVYDFFCEKICKLPNHMLLLYWGKPKDVSIEIICSRLSITPDTLVVMAFFTKDLTARNPLYE